MILGGVQNSGGQSLLNGVLSERQFGVYVCSELLIRKQKERERAYTVTGERAVVTHVSQDEKCGYICGHQKSFFFFFNLFRHNYRVG